MADQAEPSTAQLPERTKADKKKSEKPKKDKPAQKPKQEKAAKSQPTDTKGITVKKADDLAEWYQQMLSKGTFISYYDVSGCYVLEPPSFAIWEVIKAFFDKKIKTLGVKNCYYPIFISEENLQKEKDHIEGFAAEVAWVTHGGSSKLEKRVAVRPTSETAMYKDFSDKIQSYRDLPLKRNQWNNVVRWEFRNPMPFIRTREFLWQEGHTAHFSKAEADKEVLQILDFYALVYEELLACPVVKGQKTVNEQFPGALYTTTLEAFIPSTGRSVQAATSHCLGQHFSKMYNISYQNPSPEGERVLHAWQNSWGLTTRSIGVMMLIHGDDKGAVVPPRVSEFQCIILPVGTSKSGAADTETLNAKIAEIQQTLVDADVRAETDTRDNYSAGWKFADAELKGIPLRIEIGPRDLASGNVVVVRRDTGAKAVVPITNVVEDVKRILEEMQSDMFNRAKKDYDDHRRVLTDWEEIPKVLNDKCVVIIPSCCDGDCCDKVKDETAAKALAVGALEDNKAPSMGAKSLCIPFDQETYGELPKACLRPSCGKDATKWVQFGRSY